MVREQLIECMAKSAAESHRIRMCYQNKWGDLSEQTKHYWLTAGANILDALDAAGMVVVPRADLQAMIADSENGEWGNVADDLRAMTEAANAR